jgi:hypothetical protein
MIAVINYNLKKLKFKPKITIKNFVYKVNLKPDSIKNSG